jgi:hypothetical protein
VSTSVTVSHVVHLGWKLSPAREWKIIPVPARCHDFTSRSCMSFPILFLTDPLPQHHCRSSKVFLYCTSRSICIFNSCVPSRDFHSHTVSHFGHLTKSDLVSSAFTQTNHYQTFRTFTTITLKCNMCIFSANELLHEFRLFPLFQNNANLSII